jgi:hypothetical protein
MNEFESMFAKFAPKEDLRLPGGAEPARRHRCEICKQIFECHLCTIPKDCQVHAYCGPRTATPEPALVCEECAAKSENRYSARHAGYYWRDLLTGEMLSWKAYNALKRRVI